MFRRRFLAGAIVAAAAVLFSSATAEAGFQVTFYAGGSSLTVADGQAGVDLDGAANSIITVNQNVGGYLYSVTLSLTNTPGTPLLASLDASGTVSGTGATTFQIVASANGFTNPVSPPDLTAISNATFQALAQNTGSYSVSFDSRFDTTNSLVTAPAGTQIGSGAGGIGASGVVALHDVQLGSITTSPYALNFTLTATTTNTGFNAIDLDGGLQVRPVPAPAGLILAATALPFVGLLRRRLRKPEATTAA
jgi:hypothetical protein